MFSNMFSKKILVFLLILMISNQKTNYAAPTSRERLASAIVTNNGPLFEKIFKATESKHLMALFANDLFTEMRQAGLPIEPRIISLVSEILPAAKELYKGLAAIRPEIAIPHKPFAILEGKIGGESIFLDALVSPIG